jgi:hypothetical protein
MQLKSENGELLSSSVSVDGRDPVLSYQSPSDQKVVLELSDMLFTGSGNHFAFLLADHSNMLLDTSPASSPLAEKLESWFAALGRDTRSY